MGFDTGIDIDALIALRQKVETWLPDEKFYGMVAKAGLPKHYRPASALAA
jgi:hydroxymethylglutaryl-CoA lyase